MPARVRSHGSQIHRAGARSTRAPGGGTGQSACAARTGGGSGPRTRRAGEGRLADAAAGFALAFACGARAGFRRLFGADCAATAPGTATPAASEAPSRRRKPRRPPGFAIV